MEKCGQSYPQSTMFRCVHVGAAHAAHMTPITILLVEISQQTREFIRNHRTDDVRDLALHAKHTPDLDLPWALDQIAGWQTARSKLPRWADTDGIIYPPHLSMEQCSSEPTAVRCHSTCPVRTIRRTHGTHDDHRHCYPRPTSWSTDRPDRRVRRRLLHHGTGLRPSRVRGAATGPVRHRPPQP